MLSNKHTEETRVWKFEISALQFSLVRKSEVITVFMSNFENFLFYKDNNTKLI